MHHILGNKVLEYDVDDRGVIVDEREIDRTVNHKPNIADWVKEHMVFWYDMSKPVDTYAENFNDWTKFTGAKYTVTNKSVNITNFDAVNNASIYITTSKKFNGITITVDGLLDGQEIAWGYNNNSLVRMPKNGTYTLEPIDSVTGNIGFRSINIVGSCNITITQLPSGQSVPTNEILKTNPYLQDFSGNNRPLKLNNFLFAAMSGVDGYNENFLSNKWLINQNKGTVKIESSSSFVIQAIKLEHAGIVYRYVDNEKVIIKCNITGITEEIKGKFAFGYHDVTGINNIILENGYFEFITSEHEGLDGWYGFKAIIPIDNCNITVTQIPEYPGALVTDGVDDYGQVQNLQQGVKMLFMTANPLGLYKTWYAQDSFSIYGQPNTIAYNYKNTNGVTYLDGTLNETIPTNNLLNKKQIVTIVNPTDGGNNSIMFFNSYGSSYMNMAFYGSIGFDSVPTKQTDGFTEQDLIDYVLENLITK